MAHGICHCFLYNLKNKKEYATINLLSSQQSRPGLGSLFPQIRKFRYDFHAAKVLELRLEVGGNEEGTDTQTHVHKAEVTWGVHTLMK